MAKPQAKRQTTDAELLLIPDQAADAAAGVLSADELLKQVTALEANDPHLFEKIEALKRQTTDAELLMILDQAADAAAGAALSRWLPLGAGRKLI